MSGTGAAVAPRMMSATLSFCPTRGCEPAVEAERASAVDHIRAKIETAKRKGCDGHLVRVLDELAEDLVRGLHLA
jgi:hypothetical protein